MNRLPMVKISGVWFFVDERLRQIRSNTMPIVFINFDDSPEEFDEKLKQAKKLKEVI
jgi:hypothetical protein